MMLEIKYLIHYEYNRSVVLDHAFTSDNPIRRASRVLGESHRLGFEIPERTVSGPIKKGRAEPCLLCDG